MFDKFELILIIISFTIPLVISGLADFFELRKLRKLILIFEARISRLEKIDSDN